MSRTPGWRACFLCLHGRSQCQGIVMHTAVMNRDGIPNENMQKLHFPVYTLEQNPSANWVMHGKWGDIAWLFMVLYQWYCMVQQCKVLYVMVLYVLR